jgi:MFS family permease
MFSLAATWTTVVTFLPTLLLERGVALALGGPVLACLYDGLIPSAPFAGLLTRRVQQRKLLLWVPALCNTLLGIAIVLTPSPWLLMGLLTGMGVVWIVSPTIEVLPFEFLASGHAKWPCSRLSSKPCRDWGSRWGQW